MTNVLGHIQQDEDILPRRLAIAIECLSYKKLTNRINGQVVALFFIAGLKLKTEEAKAALTGAQFTCFTGTTVQILTLTGASLLALLVQKYKY